MSVKTTTKISLTKAKRNRKLIYLLWLEQLIRIATLN